MLLGGLLVNHFRANDARPLNKNELIDVALTVATAVLPLLAYATNAVADAWSPFALLASKELLLQQLDA